jgi:hypothetical protein
MGTIDGRAGMLLTVELAMIGALAAFALPLDRLSRGQVAFGLLALLGLLVSIGVLAFAWLPRLEGPKASLTYFGGIVTRDRSQYLNEVRRESPEEYLTDLASQTHRNAEIAQLKFSWMKRAIVLFYLSALPWIVFLSLVYGGTGCGAAR